MHMKTKCTEQAFCTEYILITAVATAIIFYKIESESAGETTGNFDRVL